MVSMSTHQDKVKISLSLPALERLLGGDSEMEVELRHQIVENFSKLHLREIVKTEPYRRTVQLIEQEIKDQIRDQVGEAKYSTVWGNKFLIKDEIKNQIKEAITSEVRRLIADVINERLKAFE